MIKVKNSKNCDHPREKSKHFPILIKNSFSSLYSKLIKCRKSSAATRLNFKFDVAKNTTIHCAIDVVYSCREREIKIYKCNNNSNAVEKTSALCQTLSSLDVKKIMTGKHRRGRWFGKSTFELNIKCANFWLGWSQTHSNPFFIPWNFVTTQGHEER